MKQKTNSFEKYGILGLVCLVVAAFFGVVLMITENPGNTSSKVYTEEEILRDSEGKNYSVKENGITYLFGIDGTLVISGNGTTKSFDTPEEAKVWYLEKLYHAFEGAYPKTEEQLLPFRKLLDRVTVIKIEEGITALGNSSLSPFYYTERISAPKSLKSVEPYSILGAGQYAEDTLLLCSFDADGTENYTELDASVPVPETKAATAGALWADLPMREEEERGTVPENKYLKRTIKLGENVTGNLYENGVLYITGYGSTYDFEHFFQMERHVTDALYLASRQEAEKEWFNQVVEIIIEDSVERIGDNALANYKNVRLVTGGTVPETGARAFYSMGSDTRSGVTWNITFDVTEEDSFRSCRNLPAVPEENEE